MEIKRKKLENFCKEIIRFENSMNNIIKKSSNYKIEQITNLLNGLTLENQAIMHFELGYSIDKIEKLYGKK